MTTATDGAAILKAIIDDPADDLPRLAYADWLEENGQAERAEFIRVQCELYRLEEAAHDRIVSHLSRRGYETPVPGCGCKPCDLRRRERCMWRAKDAATGGFAIPPVEPPGAGMGDFLFSEQRNPDAGSIIWRRGFPDTIHCRLKSWLDHGPALVRTHPLQRVTLTDCRPSPNCSGGGQWSECRSGAWWFGCEDSHWSDPEDLPLPLWSLLPGEPRHSDLGPPHDHPGNLPRWKRFEDDAQAMDALSAAALAWANAGRD